MGVQQGHGFVTGLAIVCVVLIVLITITAIFFSFSALDKKLKLQNVHNSKIGHHLENLFVL